MEANNMKAIREAYEFAEEFLRDYGTDWELHNKLCDMLKSALAAPPRNCDVGTLTEQQQRFHDFCKEMQHTDKACCGGCPIVHLRMQGIIGNSCELAWAQMPYEGRRK